MNKLELFVNGIGSTVGQIDLYGDEPISLSISIQDIKDISKRSSTVSQTFTIPANKNNNVLLNHIFNIGTDSSFDPRKKTPCFMLNDTVPVFTGNFQLTKINVKNSNVISYECVVYGETIDLVKTLGGSLLTDLDFSELNHNRDAQTILNSWNAETKDLGYYYPLIDYGYDLDLRELNDGVLSISVVTGTPTTATLTTLTDTTQSWTTNFYSTNYHEYSISIISGTGQGQTRWILSNLGTEITIEGFGWTVIPDTTSIYVINKIDSTNPYNSTGSGLKPSIFKPAISNTYLFKKILSTAGFSLDSDFIDSDVFAETIIPFNGTDSGLNLEDIKSFRANLSSSFSHYPSGTFTAANLVNFPFDDDSVKGYDRSNLYDTSTFKYISPAAGTVAKFYLHLSYDYNITYLPAGELSFEVFYVRYYRSSYFGGNDAHPYYQDVIPVDRCPGYVFTTTSPPVPVGAALGPHQITSDSSPTITLASGETVWVKVFVNTSSNTLYQIYDTNSCFYNRIYTNGAIDNFINMNNYIPSNIKQIDYVKSIITMFNLMVIPDKNNPKRLKFIPRNDYYGTGLIKDWTDKVDHTEKIEETLISEQQNRKIKLTYKADKDYYNTDYTEKLNLVYGEYTKEIDNEWVDGEQKIEVIFSPTILDKVFGSTDVFLPKIAKRDEKSGLYSKTDFNIRFLRKNRNLMPTTASIKVLGLPTMNSYPYCGHLDHPTTATIDYNFGEVKFSYYPELTSLTPNNLVNNYWKKFLDGIADKNSKLIKLKVYLTPNDIATFNYNDTIFIDQLTDDGGHYFIVNKITYIPTSNLPSVVELIKIEEKFDTTPAERSSLRTISINSVRGLDTGIENEIDSVGFVISGSNNKIGINSPNANVIGNNNVIAENTPGVTIINSDNNIVSTPFVTIVGNTYYDATGISYVNYNDIENGVDEILNPFTSSLYNDIENGVDAVLNIGGISPIKDIESGLSDAGLGEDLPFTP